MGKEEMRGRIVKKSSFVKRVLLPVLVSFLCAGAVTAIFFVSRAGNASGRAVLRVGDKVYINPYEPQATLPFDYDLAGILTEEQANGTGLAGCEYYVNRFDEDGIYVYQRCGLADAGGRAAASPRMGENGKNGWMYQRWIRVEEEKFSQPRLTLKDVVCLAEKGSALKEEDFDHYSYFGTGVEGMRVYEIDGNFSLWLTGARGWRSEPGALRIYLRSRDAWGWEDLFDIRTGDVREFVREHQETVPREKTAGEETAFPYPDEGIGNYTCIGDYWYQGTHVSMYDNGDACVYLSMLDSYMGIGTYEVEGERVVIRTKDGWYTYYFDIVGDTLVFDGKASKWRKGPSKLVDGAVLEK